jgi:hypothetical protein
MSARSFENTNGVGTAMQRRWPHLLGGAVALGLGVYGVYDEYFTVIEFLKGSLQPLLVFGGIIAILAGILGNKPKPLHIIGGLVLVGIGIYGFFDEYYATLDFFKGAVPVALLLVGTISVVSGVKLLGGGRKHVHSNQEGQK